MVSGIYCRPLEPAEVLYRFSTGARHPLWKNMISDTLFGMKSGTRRERAMAIVDNNPLKMSLVAFTFNPSPREAEGRRPP